MPVPKISRAAKAAVITRLADVATGFNPLLAASLSDAGLDPTTNLIGWKLPIDFTSRNGRNFMLADLKPEDLDSTSAATYPFMSLFALDAVETNRQKFQLFSGDIHLGLNLFLSWKSSRLLPDFETAGDCCEEALIQTFNAVAVAAWSLGAGGLVYNGDITVSRGRLSKDAENWFQNFACRLTIECHTAG